jgi:hypothetical protein
MCVTSMITQHYGDKWEKQWPDPIKPWNPQDSSISTPESLPKYLTQAQIDKLINLEQPISRKEFDILKKEVEEMKTLMIKAIQYDKEHNEPHCEQEEKIALIRKMAKLVGVDMSEVLNGLEGG